MKLLRQIRFEFQKFIVFLSILLNISKKWKPVQKSWVVVGVETASMLHNLARAIPGSTSVNFEKNSFYQFEYDYNFPVFSKLRFLDSLIFRPWVLGKLLFSHEGIIYLGSNGFCDNSLDGRAWEFSILKKHKRKIVCYFVGSEIRSFKLLDAYGIENEIDVLTTYQRYTAPKLTSFDNEKLRQQLAETADQYANFIFNPPVDQLTYIKSQTYPCHYFLSKEIFNFNPDKLRNIRIPIVIHASSSPVIKGTPLVRAAVKKLKMEGYIFEYREFLNVPHSELLKNLRDAHIVLSQFYSFVPGIFALEGLANTCAVLTSADPKIEKSLPKDSADAWFVTPYWLVYDHLKRLLENHELIKTYAEYGHSWVKDYAFDEIASKRFLKIISQKIE